MKEVTKDQFYARINPLDVVGSVHKQGDGTYRQDLKTRGGYLIGRTVTTYGAKMITSYWLATP